MHFIENMAATPWTAGLAHLGSGLVPRLFRLTLWLIIGTYRGPAPIQGKIDRGRMRLAAIPTVLAYRSRASQTQGCDRPDCRPTRKLFLLAWLSFRVHLHVHIRFLGKTWLSRIVEITQCLIICDSFVLHVSMAQKPRLLG